MSELLEMRDYRRDIPSVHDFRVALIYVGPQDIVRVKRSARRHVLHSSHYLKVMVLTETPSEFGHGSSLRPNPRGARLNYKAISARTRIRKRPIPARWSTNWRTRRDGGGAIPATPLTCHFASQIAQLAH